MRAENIIFLLLLLYILFHYFKRSEVEYLYIRNFLPEQEHKKVVEECRKLEPFMEKDELSIVKNRNKHTFSHDDYISQVFSSTHVRERLKELNASPSNTPVEYRTYGEKGMMGWHCDDQLYIKPQYEIVYTTENTSDSKMQWFDPTTKELHSISTEPNSVFVVRARTVLHRVSPVNHGERKIIKFAYV